MKFVEGEQVLAKEPSTGDYLEGQVLVVKGDLYQIKFDNGTQDVVYEDNIQPKRPSRNTTKNSSRATVQEKKSPSRKPGKRRSPSRKSPSRQSPGRSPSVRVRKILPRATKLPQKTTSTTTDEDDDDLQTEEVSEMVPLQIRLKEGPTATRRSVRILTNMQMRSSGERDRAASLPTPERKSAITLEAKDRGYSVQREIHLLSDLSTTTATTTLNKKDIEFVGTPQEWGGWLGALCLIFLLPAVVISPQIMYEHHWPDKLESWINAGAIFFGYLGLLTILSILPIGRIVDGQQNKTGKLQYRINGLLSAIVVMLIIFGIGEYHQGYRASDYILDNTMKLTIIAWVFATILSISLYIKANHVPISTLNIYGSTENVFYDFWQGREINPRLGKLDVKIVLHHFAIITTMIINTAIIIKQSQKLAVIPSALHIFFCLDYLVFEASTLTSFSVMYEGTGYMVCVGNILYPFVVTLGSQIVYRENIQCSEYVLGVLAVSYFIGYLVYRVANMQKDDFRKNPTHISQTSDAITTLRGKKILVSSLWGHVRHPNYLGHLIMVWSMSFMTKWYYAAILLTIILIHRAIRDNRRCKLRYGTAWEQYCLRVNCMIIKYVF